MKIRIFNAFVRKIYSIILKNRRRVSIGKEFRADFRTNIYLPKGTCNIGDNCLLRSNAKGYHAGMSFATTLFVDKKDAKIEIGNNCRINGTYIHAQKTIKIGNNCVIASGVNIIDSNGHELYSNDRTVGRDEPKEIIIGNNVWIGLNCIILKETTIGDNSVVAAGSVVKGNFPANSLIQGNPAAIIKKLEIIK